MTANQERNTRINVIKRPQSSWMEYMNENRVYDKDKEAYVSFLETFEMPDFTDVQDTEQEYVVQSEYDRLDVVANQYYGDPALWWVIAARNNLDLPDADLYEGLRLRIPSYDFVRSNIIGKFKKRSVR